MLQRIIGSGPGSEVQLFLAILVLLVGLLLAFVREGSADQIEEE